MSDKSLNYENYIKLFDALSHPTRIKIAGIFAKQRRYVSELSKLVNTSRPLLYMHLKKMEDAGLVSCSYEISELGKTMNYYELKPFSIDLTLELIEKLADTMPAVINIK